jgi:hypothetical protein
MSHKGWVLVTEGGGGQSRAAVAAVRALAAANYRPVVTVSQAMSMAAASRSCAGRVHVPSAERSPQAYATAIRAEQSRWPYVAVLPSSEAALLALGGPLEHLQHKALSSQAASAVGIPVPRMQVFASMDELRSSAAELEYPIVVKPDLSKLFPTTPVHSFAELARLGPWEGTLVVQPCLSGGFRGVVGLMWGGKLLVATHMRYVRLWPLPTGTVSAAESVSPDSELERGLEALLQGYDGPFHVDLAGPYLLDVNLRIHATLPLSIAAGANVVTAYCDLRTGQSVAPVRGRPGVFFRWIEGDLRSILWSLRRGQLSRTQALKAALPRRGAVHGYESARDPGPTLARIAYAARRVLTRRSLDSA